MELTAIIAGLLIGILTDEFLCWSHYLAEWMVRNSAKRVPAPLRSRYEEEWLAHLEEIPGRVSKLVFAIDTYRAYYKIKHYHFFPNVSCLVPIFIRIIDFNLALVLLVCCLPTLVVISSAILIEDWGKGSIFFRQERVGRYNKKFQYLRFRTLSFKLTSQSRIGSILKKTSLEYFPVIINVLRGEMSFVGPMPVLPSIAENIEENIKDFDCRHYVRPGILCWADEYTNIREMSRYDNFFVENLSLRLYLKTLFGAFRYLKKPLLN